MTRQKCVACHCIAPGERAQCASVDDVIGRNRDERSSEVFACPAAGRTVIGRRRQDRNRVQPYFADGVLTLEALFIPSAGDRLCSPDRLHRSLATMERRPIETSTLFVGEESEVGGLAGARRNTGAH